MKKYIGVFIGLNILIAHPAMSEDMSFDFNDFTITTGDDASLLTETVDLNSGADVASVGAFDIAGIMLGMTFDEVHNMFYDFKSLYAPREKDGVVYSIQKDWKYNLDYECRQQGIVIPSELEQCINSMAKNRGLLYASELHMVRESTGETIVVYFTSNATDNVVWRVVYNNDVNEQEGANEKFAKQRENKILFFWQSVLDKYGAPNSGSDKWISSTSAYDPMMTAYYGTLDLIDNGRNTSDQVKNIQYARENFAAKPYAF